jgi:hypothetical protein
LKRSNLLGFFDPKLTIYSNGFTERTLIEAAAKARSARGRALFVGEHCTERALALQSGFAAAIPHPSLVSQVMEGGTLAYARVSKLDDEARDGRFKSFFKMPVVPFHLTVEGQGSAYIITSTRIAEVLRDIGLDVTIFGNQHDPQVTDVYLAHDDRKVSEKDSIDFLARQDKARFVVSPTDGALLLALPPSVPIEEIHFPNARHGHNKRLLADPSLLIQLAGDSPIAATAPRFRPNANVTLKGDDVKALQDGITSKSIKRLHAPYVGDAPLVDGTTYKITTRYVETKDNELVTDALLEHLKRIGGNMMTVRKTEGFYVKGVSRSNIEAELIGTDPNSVVIISAHLDSIARNDGVNSPAPGADDDASGVAGVLAAAEVAVKLRREGGQLKRSLRFVLFNAEEDYILGSQVYVLSQLGSAVRIVAVFQMDMIGYSGGRPQKEFEVHVGCRNNSQAETESLALAWTIESVVKQVSTVLNSPQIYQSTGFDPLDNRSDHSPFQLKGYAACVVTEDGHEGPLATSPSHRENLDYHRRSDIKIDYDYAAEIARVVAAAAFVTAKS